MCNVTRTKYRCRHTISEYTFKCRDANKRCEKKITNLSSDDECSKCAPDERHQAIVNLYAKYKEEMQKLVELAKAENCRTMVIQTERIIKALVEERLKALAELQVKIEAEAAAKKRLAEELAQESKDRWV
jgi:predicted amidophosphoribosyltransferase